MYIDLKCHIKLYKIKLLWHYTIYLVIKEIKQIIFITIKWFIIKFVKIYWVEIPYTLKIQLNYDIWYDFIEK